MDRWMDGENIKGDEEKKRVRSCVGGNVDAERGVLASGKERGQKRGAKWKKGRVTNAAAGGKKAHKEEKRWGIKKGVGG